MNNIFLNNTMQSWLFALIYVVATIILSRLLKWIFNSIKKNRARQEKFSGIYIFIDLLEKPIIFGVVIFGFWLALQHLNFENAFDKGIRIVYYILITLNIAWLVANLFNTFIEKFARQKVEDSGSKMGKQVLSLLKSVVNIFVWVIAIIFALKQAGYDVGALLAGLGIGGLAIALAAKDSAANIFGGIAIFSDRSFQVGDRIKIKGYDGIVEEVGIRVTRIRTFAGTLISLPNSVFTSTELENVSVEPSRRIVLELGLTYDTPPGKMKRAMDILKDIISKNEHTEEKVLLSFDAFRDSSLNILFIYYIKAGEDILETQTEVNLEILDRFNSEGLEFAFPTMTQYRINPETN